jgi:hypothetical protein
MLSVRRVIRKPTYNFIAVLATLVALLMVSTMVMQSWLTRRIDEAHRQQYKPAVNKARADFLRRCPSLSPSKTSEVGVAPGSLDIVITTVNFTTSSDPDSPTYVKLDIDNINFTCEPRATIDEHEHGPGTKVWPQFHPHRCDHFPGSASCCVRASPSKLKWGRWGTCQVPSESNAQCRCRNCFDFRLRRRALQFNEVRQQLRSFETNGLFVQSKEQPHGVIRKIFVVYNEGPGNSPPPTWLREDYSHVVAVPHKTLFLRHDPHDLTGYPTANRNAIVALLRLIPGLESDWILYIEDDMFLNKPLSFHGELESYFTKDGRVVSHLNRDGGIHSSDIQSKSGYTGAMWSANNALAKRFGPRTSSSRSLVEGLEHELIGRRHGESAHHVYLWPRCVLDELYMLWEGEYNDTIRSRFSEINAQHFKDLSLTTHAGMFLEDLGLGKNDLRLPHMAEWHTNSQGGGGPRLEDFVRSVCLQVQKKVVDWLQVQGDGISDEYIGETNEARGDIRFAWQAMSEAMWPKRSDAEIEVPFGGDNVYAGMALREHGEALCLGISETNYLRDLVQKR